MTAAPSTLRLGATLFRLRSLTPVPVLAACLALLWRGRVAPAGDGLALDVAGLLLAALGQGVRFYTLGHVPEGTSGQERFLTAAALNTRGPYARVRNPLYLGNLGIVAGLLCVAGDPWVALLALAFFFGEYFFIIRAEEAYLRRTFGAAYDDFCREVPRWVPRLSPARSGALRGGGFDWVRALKKEINPFAAWTSGVLGLWLWQSWAQGALDAARLGALVALEVAVLSGLLFVKAWKKGWILHGA